LTVWTPAEELVVRSNAAAIGITPTDAATLLLRLLLLLLLGPMDTGDHSSEMRGPVKFYSSGAYNTIKHCDKNNREPKTCNITAGFFLALSALPGGVMVRALHLRLRRSRVRLPALRFQALGKLFTHLCLCHQAV